MTSFTPEDSIRARGLCIEIPDVSIDRAAAMIELHRIAETRQFERAEKLDRQLEEEQSARARDWLILRAERKAKTRWKWTAIVSMILSAALIVGMVVHG